MRKEDEMYDSFFDELEKIAEETKSNLKRNLAIGGGALAGAALLGLGASKLRGLRALKRGATSSVLSKAESTAASKAPAVISQAAPKRAARTLEEVAGPKLTHLRQPPPGVVPKAAEPGRVVTLPRARDILPPRRAA
jgi:hypothetical protein